ncbi:hypothetical protein JD844_005108 [Phrynosoma platyrhinos]|uniref:Uncharacterized protein n=1 Tax=Phrynosoma platyrhinos TaxID=52577 RepID=A0ABQ7SED0_PHRPL|nr:hypothetical protein JD844_005108 [Phrynosoma platyrhinos]
MRLACLFVSVVALCSLKISGAEIPHGFDLPLNSSNEGETEDNNNIVRRAVRRRAQVANSPAQLSCGCRPSRGAPNSQNSDYCQQYPEESEHVDIGHRQASIRVSPVECSCSGVLGKGTLVAIVAALAFLGFFSTSILLVVAICILRLVEKQKKKEKEEKPARSSRRRLPPVPRAARGIYLSASELNPGPRWVSRQDGKRRWWERVAVSSAPGSPEEDH